MVVRSVVKLPVGMQVLWIQVCKDVLQGSKYLYFSHYFDFLYLGIYTQGNVLKLIRCYFQSQMSGIFTFLNVFLPAFLCERTCWNRVYILLQRFFCYSTDLLREKQTSFICLLAFSYHFEPGNTVSYVVQIFYFSLKSFSLPHLLRLST